LGFERLQLKNGKLRCFFVTNPASPYYDSSTFQKMMKYPALVGDRFLSFKPVGNALTLVRENVKTVKNALELLEEMKRLVKV
jgi:transcription-repair coupling factor (superfamily II helicase)